MPRWLGRVFYAFRGKRSVRLHLVDRPGVPAPTLEGVLVGRFAGHYVLLVPKLVQSGGAPIELEGVVEVPTEQVLFLQVLSS